MKVQLTRQSAEWNKIDYRLQLITGKASVKLISIYKLSEDEGIGQESIVNITDFSKEYQNQVITKTVALQDVIFYCGHVNIHQYATQRFKVFTFLICRAKLGRIGYPKDDVSKCNSIIIPEQGQNEALQYNFFLRTHEQYTVLYQASFTLSDQKDFKISDFECSNCQNRIPTRYCKSQNIFFCEDCYLDNHRTKILITHESQPVDKINTLGVCKNHNQKIDFFCLKCQKYLCQLCTQKGAHHQNFEHPIKPIAYYYQETRQNIQVLPRKHKQKVDALLFNLQVKKKQVEANHLQVKQFLISKHQKLLNQLDQITDQKLQTLNSCQIQLKMLNDKIQWAKAFAKFQDKSLKPIQYFHSQIMFQQELAKLKIAQFQPIFTIKANIETEGDIKVGTRDSLQSYKYKKSLANNTYFSPKKQQSEYERLRNQSLLKRMADQQSLLQYNKNSIMPKKGDLSLIIENSNFKFFQISAK